MYVFAKWSVALFSLCLMSVANAQNVHGVLRVVKGDVQIKSAKTGKPVKARIGEKVFPKDVILTGKDSRAKIVMVDNNEINVSPESQIEIQHYEYNPAEGKKDVLLNVIYGKVRSKVEQKYDGKTTKFQIKTPSAVAGVRGTDFMMGYSQSTKQSNVITFQGRVDFGTLGPGGAMMNPVSVTPGTQASNSPGAPPSQPTSVPKEDLAKMDNDTKADGPKTDGISSERQPSSDKKDDKKEDKKDGDKAGPKSGDGGDKPKRDREPSSVGGGEPGPGPTTDVLPPPTEMTGECKDCRPPPPPTPGGGNGGGCMATGTCPKPPDTREICDANCRGAQKTKLLIKVN